jgi:uncharacterized protein YeaO (DUF488 family)
MEEGVMVRLKHARDPISRADGYRVLVDRLWPRGVRKEELEIDEWAKDIAPSTELRKWFGHDPERWAVFQRRYRTELHSPSAAPHLDALAERAAHGTLTLVFSSHDTARNNAVVLRDELERRTHHIAHPPPA